MNNRTILCGMQSVAFALMVTLAAPGAALAAHGGGAHGGGGWAYSGHFDSRIGAYGGGYHGWRGGYGYYGGWGWDANYYAWNSAVREFETVRPPPQVESQIATQEPTGADLFAYPKNAQNTEQQARDRYECHRGATDQTGFDPMQSGGVPPAASTQASGTVVAATVATPTKRQDYLRAQAACLEARGYSVK